MFCLGHCYENNAFHYDGKNFAGKDINKIDEIIKGQDIEQDKFYSKSFSSTSFLMDEKLLNVDQFKKLLEKLNCEIIHINNTPNGIFPRNPEPKTENIKEISTLVFSGFSETSKTLCSVIFPDSLSIFALI